MTEALTYDFGDGTADGSGELKDLLGGKGAGLAEMSLLGIPVPPGFTLTTHVCSHFHRSGGDYPEGLEEQVEASLRLLEDRLDQGFGDAERPLLVSVRSGAPISMPGMMDTILNLGLTREMVRSQADAETRRFLADCYRRLLAMYGEVVLKVPARRFQEELERCLGEGASEAALDGEGLETVIDRYEGLLEDAGVEVPQEPRSQLWGAIGAVFRSWDNQRARDYRRLHGISDRLGTGVTVQAMVFGNRGSDCATGVAFSRNPATGVLELYGEYLVNAQGEDVVAGTHTPRPIRAGGDHPGLQREFPEAYEALEEVCGILERHFRNMQDLEFTIQHGRLYMLQTRAGKRSGPAAVRIAVDMVRERLIDRREALRRVEPQHLEQMLAPEFETREWRRAIDEGRSLGKGLGAGPGAASGRIAFTADRAEEMARDGAVILVRNETSPEDIVGMHASAGILTTRGGMTSHAAVVARGLGKPCIVGAGDLQVDDRKGSLRAGERVLREGEEISIDGSRGVVLAGALTVRPSRIVDALLGAGGHVPGGDGAGNDSVANDGVAAFRQLLRWADRERRLGVRANADSPEDAEVARRFGAEGIGLCRTEHMFFEDSRIPWVRRLILARAEDERRRALDALLPVQQSDFEGIFRALDGAPVTIRLLDPPLHEFLPAPGADLAPLARAMERSVDDLERAIEELSEVNPMLGHRGCRLGLTLPMVYDMQVEAIARAGHTVAADGVAVRAEIMIPLTGVAAEMERLRARVEEVLDRVADELSVPRLEVLIGTMIEVPRAALVADQLARHADFFSFGTNDLTQMTFGYSRDDAARFLGEYLEQGILSVDPFSRIDEAGVGQLVDTACRRGRMARPDLKLGICGEHGGEPNSIDFFERCGLDYVSCSPYRLPVARLAAARATLGLGAGGAAETYEGA